METKKIETAINSKIAFITKYIMKQNALNEHDAYIKLSQTEIFRLIMNKNTNLYIEPVDFIIEAYNLEKNASKKEMIEYISNK